MKPRSLAERPLQQAEIGAALVVENDRLAVEDHCLKRELARRR